MAHPCGSGYPFVSFLRPLSFMHLPFQKVSGAQQRIPLLSFALAHYTSWFNLSISINNNNRKLKSITPNNPYKNSVNTTRPPVNRIITQMRSSFVPAKSIYTLLISRFRRKKEANSATSQAFVQSTCTITTSNCPSRTPACPIAIGKWANTTSNCPQRTPACAFTTGKRARTTSSCPCRTLACPNTTSNWANTTGKCPQRSPACPATTSIRARDCSNYVYKQPLLLPESLRIINPLIYSTIKYKITASYNPIDNWTR